MAGNTVRKLAGPAYLAASATNIYNPGTNLYGLVRHIHVANKTAAAATFTLYIGLTGGSAGGTELFAAKNVPANDSFDYWCFTKMLAADFLSGLASAGSTLVITVEGEEGAV